VTVGDDSAIAAYSSFFILKLAIPLFCILQAALCLENFCKVREVDRRFTGFGAFKRNALFGFSPKRCFDFRISEKTD